MISWYYDSEVAFMKRLLVSLDDDRYEDLRRLAFEKKVSMAKLVRFAIDKTFEDDLDRVAGERGLEEYLRDPSGTMTIEEYMESRGIELPRRRPSKATANARPAPRGRSQTNLKAHHVVGRRPAAARS